MSRNMLRRMLRGPADRVEFCDGRGSVCDGRCRSQTIRDATRNKGLASELRRI